ncbi:MAG: hypothetical protein LBS49_07460 [Candidatus Accumulibacter sp.]|jgi:hypothetical protein|nr:hypothetical protein [Accumulibacter sp.]
MRDTSIQQASFRQKPESGVFHGGGKKPWIPAFAGMTEFVVPGCGLGKRSATQRSFWIPAFAGMTESVVPEDKRRKTADVQFPGAKRPQILLSSVFSPLSSDMKG